MKCPRCGAWNQAFLNKCMNCGADLPEATDEKLSWEDKLHNKKPSLRITKYELDEDAPLSADEAEDPENPAHDDPDAVGQSELSEELEELSQRREEGTKKLESLKEHAEEIRRSFRETEVIRPAEDVEKKAEPQRIRRNPDAELDGVVYSRRRSSGSGRPSSQPVYIYTEKDEDAPVFHDGYVPEDDLTDGDGQPIMPRRIDRAGNHTVSYADAQKSERKKKSAVRRVMLIVLLLVFTGLFAAGGMLAARLYVQSQGQQVTKTNDAYTECIATETEDGHPAHTIIVHGRENATVYLQETASSYIVADGIVSVTIPDYMWYDTDSSSYATATNQDTMDVTISPFIRYSQEGEQFEIEPIQYTIDVPESPVYLLNPATIRSEVGVSVFEVRINVLKGSTVIIDGTNVSTLIRETGNVSKNVQVLPVGDNVISISVKSKYYRETVMDVTLYRAPQEIPLELSPTVITEWNYEADNPLNQASISGSTLPGATVTVESPHENLVVDNETGSFTFKPLFPSLGDNKVIIRASYEGREDSVITHTVYYMPTADVYTRKAWDLDSQYSDLINYMSIRKGTIYVGTGVIKRIISTTPQLAVMDIGTSAFSKEVLLENSSKTTWVIGTKYKIYGEAYGLYDTMPRLTVRYTYLMED